MLKIMNYESDKYILKNNKEWVNISERFADKTDRASYIKGLIKKEMIAAHKPVSSRLINDEYAMFMMDVATDHSIMFDKVNINQICFLNGFFDENMDWNPVDGIKVEMPFTPFQIKRNYVPETDLKAGTRMAEFFEAVSDGDKDLKQLILEIVGTCMSSRNMSVMPIFKSPQSTSGKGTVIEIIQKLIGFRNITKLQHEKWLGNKGSNFALSSIRQKTVAWMDELPKQLDKSATEKIKDYVDSKSLTVIERKGIDEEVIANTMTFVGLTNNNISIYNIDDAIKKRIIWVPFNMNRGGKMRFTTVEIFEILNNEDGLDWLVHEAMMAFKEVMNRTGTRNARYTQAQKSLDVWLSIESDNAAAEMIESDEVLAGLFDNRETFWSNEDIKSGMIAYNEKNGTDLKLKSAQNEIFNFLSSKKLGEASLHNNGSKGGRGIKIEWYTQEEFITNEFGVKVRKEDWEEFLNVQAEEDKHIQGFIHE